MQLNATPFQLTLLACAKPVVSLVAFQSTSVVTGKPHKNRFFLWGASLLASLPCLAFPWVDNVWFYIGAYALFMTALRASLPVWIEILKIQSKENQLPATAAKGSAINYFMLIFIPVIIGPWMDYHPEIWRGLFCALGLLQLLNILVIFFLAQNTPYDASLPSPCLKSLFNHWHMAWQALKGNPHFIRYHLLFFLGGVGLVAVQPILPIFFKENLHLSYTQLTLAFSLCKGIAFVLSSPYWVKMSHKCSLFRLNGWINAFSVLFFLLILTAAFNIHSLYAAYLMYGAMQAGCELSWNLSGPYFAKEKESTLYSSINLACVGFRGCICPFLGQWLFSCGGSLGVILFSGVVSAISLLYAISMDRQIGKQLPQQINY